MIIGEGIMGSWPPDRLGLTAACGAFSFGLSIDKVPILGHRVLGMRWAPYSVGNPSGLGVDSHQNRKEGLWLE